jgi:hypothetical protein
VLLSARAVAKLADLGVAHEVQARGMTRLGAKLGTPEYMSPEQHRGEAVEARSDIYSAGVVLYELLAGALPFRHNSEYELAKAHVHEAPDLAPLEREAGPALAAVVGRALAKTLADRWPTAASMAAHWADAAQQSGFSVQRTPGTAQDSGAHSVAVPNSDVRNAVVEPAGGPALRVLNGPRAAQTLAFRDGRLALGRRDPDLGSLAGREEFDDPAMSWAHCTFVVQPDARVVVYDDGSLNGTWVDGVRVEGGSWVVAKSVVVAGRTRVAFVGDGE